MTDQEKEWLEDMEISPTALFKQKLMEFQSGTIGMRKDLKETKAIAARLVEFLNKKDLMQEYSDWLVGRKDGV